MGEFNSFGKEWNWEVGGGSPAPSQTQVRSRLRHALALLGLPEVPTLHSVVASAYRSAVRRSHPDSGGESGVPIGELQAARDLVNAAINQAAAGENKKVDKPCGWCGGSGTIANRFAAEVCSACGGSGVAK